VLREAGLVTVRREGRRQMYALDPRPLTEVRDWLAHFNCFWDGKLDALGAFLDGVP
jgi:DNA-binding transcriptional ArsR family regulator